jgi:predicted anti-sigma-YlaC factor YlaD
MTCTEVREAAAEFALDILNSEERSVVAAHLIRCPECRAEVDALTAVGARLLELVPGTEPPLGFDRRVLAQVRPDRNPGRRLLRRRPRLMAGLAAVAAAVVLVVASLGWFQGGTSPHTPRAVLSADFVQGSRDVGEVYAYANPAWWSMTVHGATGTNKVTCELVGPKGTVTTIGSFDLVDGSGSWGAPDRTGLAGVTGAQLVDGTGHVIAVATFH